MLQQLLTIKSLLHVIVFNTCTPNSKTVIEQRSDSMYFKVISVDHMCTHFNAKNWDQVSGYNSSPCRNGVNTLTMRRCGRISRYSCRQSESQKCHNPHNIFYIFGVEVNIGTFRSIMIVRRIVNGCGT